MHFRKPRDNDGRVYDHSVEGDLRDTFMLIRVFNTSAERTNKYMGRSLIYQYVDWLAQEWARTGGMEKKIAPLAEVLGKMKYRDLPTLARALTPLANPDLKPPPPSVNPWRKPGP